MLENAISTIEVRMTYQKGENHTIHRIRLMLASRGFKLTHIIWSIVGYREHLKENIREYPYIFQLFNII